VCSSDLVEHVCVRAFSGDESRPSVRLAIPEALRVETDPDRLTQVLLNVLRNARDAVGKHGHIEINGEATADGARIVVRDDGPGLAPEAAARLFEPFFTTKEPGQGTGLGLYTSYLVMQRLGGKIEIDSPDGGGARVTVTLPRQATRAAAPRSADNAPPGESP
jgi:signal transduction histidine kinase